MTTSHHLNYRIRAAQPVDIPNILAIFAAEVEAGRMLPRNAAKMETDILTWRVAQLNDQIIGCVSLVFFNPTLCEIRSLAVAETYRQNGLGKRLVQAALELALDLGAERILTLTRAPGLFEALGFETGVIEDFPQKVQQDCQQCPFIDRCDETTLLYTVKQGVPA